MTPNYPNSIDNSTSLPNPNSNSAPNNPGHAELHTEVNDILIALETKVGTGNSTPGAGTNKYILTSNGDGSTSWLGSSASAPSPLTTKGDLYGFSTVNARIPVGADGTTLTADSTQATGVKWSSAGSGNVVGPSSSTSGDIVTWNNTSGTLVADGGIASSALSTLTGTQTLTNKSISGSSNTLTNIPLTTAVTGVLPIANGGTGSSTQNFVDLTTAQTIAGVKTFSSAPVLPSQSITGSEIANNTVTLSQIATSALNVGTGYFYIGTTLIQFASTSVSIAAVNTAYQWTISWPKTFNTASYGFQGILGGNSLTRQGSGTFESLTTSGMTGFVLSTSGTETVYVYGLAIGT